MKRWRKIFILTGLCLALLCGCAAAEAGVSAWVGYDGTALAERWYPLFVQVTAGEQAMEGTIQTRVAAELGKADEWLLPVSVPAGETKTYRLTIRPGSGQMRFDVQLTGSEACSTVARAANMIPGEALVIGVLGAADGLCDALGDIERTNIHGEREMVAAIALTGETFPIQEREMHAFDALVVMDDAQKRLSPEGAALLTAWEAEGGILIRRGGDVSASPALAAQQVIGEIEEARQAGKGIRTDDRNYAYSQALQDTMRIGGTRGFTLAAILLIAYVLIAGVGAYVLLRRRDRSTALWLALPALSGAACVLLAALSLGLGLNQPMSSAVHVTHIDAKGKITASEMAAMTCAGQERKRIETLHGAPLERVSYGYYSGRMDEADAMALRDRIMLGDAPYLELEGKADWLVRGLVIGREPQLQGGLTASAYVEEDGLHVEVRNDTDKRIENATLLTGVGFARLGDLTPGETAQALLARTDEMKKDKHGNVMIAEGTMPPYTVSLFQLVDCAVDPERASDAEFKRSTLTQQERYRRSIEEYTLQMGIGVTDQDFACMLIGETPEIACDPLLVNGRRIDRRAEKSVLIGEIAVDSVSPDGWFYLPERTFKPMHVSLEAGDMPVLGKDWERNYVYDMNEALMGFKLEGVDRSEVQQMRLYAAGGLDMSGDDRTISVQAYDYAKREWTALSGDECMIIDQATAQRIVSEAGEICLRFAGEEMAQYGLRLPSLIVEGRRQQKGGEDA